MKRVFKFVLKRMAILTFVFAIGAALASARSELSSAWYYLDSNGDPVERIVGEPSCNPGAQNCAQMFNENAQQEPTTPIGDPVKGAIHQN